eukprot:Blabericola_migrator_1__3997@NODE_2211_length_3118_cov_24_631924_g1392_i0_p1_GENE_NODE_2211_length_3118_cov_24_631924_g1392_i0NODE_2211_length_3118_cov_24_631924_g1392_i0_p1_ORF_typecomplete_len565_score70_89Spindle_Spc25/PF08234_12/2_5Spindle_Spc25/PF08234_12/6e02PRIMA1/PF16101_5/1_2PRIMA1/PF16101_5/5e03_NODE_2211_length_3118_cov_24_631924_g1392_i014243079
MRGFLESVRAGLIGVPLKKPNAVALQRLLRTEFDIINELKSRFKGKAKSESETKIREIFTNRLDSLWPSITDGLDSRVRAALDKKYAETVASLNQTSTLWSLVRSVRKLTPDPRVLAVCSYVILNNLFRGAKGAPIPDKSNYSLVKVTPDVWKSLVCPVLDCGVTHLDYWFRTDATDGKREIYACIDEASRMADKVLQVWRDYRGHSPCQSETHTRGQLKLDSTSPAPANSNGTSYDFSCREVMQKRLRRFDSEFSKLYCDMVEERKWAIQASHHPDGLFTYCADVAEDLAGIRSQFAEHDKAQYRQLECRPEIKANLSNGIPPELRVSDATLTFHPPAYFATEGTLLLEGDDVGDWWMDCGDIGKFQRIEKISFKDLPDAPPPPPPAPPEPTYILGPPGEHSSTIDVDGVTSGLYEKTTVTPSEEPMQSTTLDFSYPFYPTLVTSEATAAAVASDVTAVGPLVLDSTTTVFPYAASISIMTAIAGAIYYHYSRRHEGQYNINDTNTAEIAEVDEGHPLWGVETAGELVSPQAAKETLPTCIETDNDSIAH